MTTRVTYSDNHRSLSILVNGAAGNFLATAEDLKTKGFRVCCKSECTFMGG
jgi:hypothetical protein